MATTKQVELWFCDDCTIAEVNGDYTGFEDEKQIERTNAGLDDLAEQGHIAANWGGEDEDDESGIADFSWSPCDCCGSRLGGSRHRFALFLKAAQS